MEDFGLTHESVVVTGILRYGWLSVESNSGVATFLVLSVVVVFSGRSIVINENVIELIFIVSLLALVAAKQTISSARARYFSRGRRTAS